MIKRLLVAFMVMFSTAVCLADGYCSNEDGSCSDENGGCCNEAVDSDYLSSNPWD